MSYSELTPEAAHAELDRFRIIDVREAHEFHGPLGFVEGAELVPLSTVAEHAEKLAGPRPLLLVCRSGKRSGQACETLVEQGVRDVTNLDGGMIAWNRAELPVLRTELETLEALLASATAWLAQVTASGRSAAHGQIEALLLDAGATLERPTTAAIDHALESIATRLRSAGAPPDLDLTLVRYRRDLAVL